MPERLLTVQEAGEMLNTGEPGRPKSDAWFRTVALPSVLVAVVREHLAEFHPSARKPADDII